MKKEKMNNKGFSLVELIIVVAIMAVLVVVLAPQYLKYVEKSRVSADASTAAEFESVMSVLASDVDVTLSSSNSGKYTVTSDADSGEITISTELKAAIDAAGTMDTTKKYKFTSTAFKEANEILSLIYDTGSKMWKVEVENVPAVN